LDSIGVGEAIKHEDSAFNSQGAKPSKTGSDSLHRLISMTDPAGCSFLSYRRSRAEEARRLIYALREHGIPTWQDVHDLEFVPTEPEIRRVIDAPSTANAILFVTPEVETSAVIRNIEAPLILARHLRNEGFFAVPVAAGGLDYTDLPRILGDGLGHAYISGWNVHRPKSDPLDDEGAACLANAILDQRLAAISRVVPADTSLEIEIATRAPLAKQAGSALKIDLAHCFDDRRLAKPGAWDRILLAFDNIVRVLQKNGRRDVVCSGMLVLPAAVAFGASFLAPARVNTTWVQDQAKFGLPPTMLGLHVPREPSGFVSETYAYAPDGDDLALLISVAGDVTHDSASRGSN
jgi:hypothetical protein